MENSFPPLLTELTQIKELMMQLEAQLDQGFPVELGKLLVSKALLAAEKLICMAGKSSFSCPSCGPELSPPHSASGSPRSDGSDHGSKFRERRELLPKKRKALPTRRSQVKVGSECGVEAAPLALDDGYSWRKYGQKDILAAKYPRGYYRCTHRNTQGCSATKQVQRTDEDPTVYDVTYHGTHTCQQRAHLIPARAKAQEQIMHQGPDQNHSDPAQGQLRATRSGLPVKTEGAFGRPSTHEELNCVPFTFPSTTNESNGNIYFSSHALEDCFPGAAGGGFSSSFVSLATSDSDYFSPPLRGLRLHKSESDLTEVISAATSTTNSPMADMDLMLDGLEFNPSFHLDASSFF